MDERTPVGELSDRALLEESVVLLRAFSDALMMLTQSPMFSAMMPAPNPLIGR